MNRQDAKIAKKEFVFLCGLCVLAVHIVLLTNIPPASDGGVYFFTLGALSSHPR